MDTDAERRDDAALHQLQTRTNEGSSITYSVHQIAAEVIRYNKLAVSVWIEHFPKEATDGTSETFELVVFSNYEIRERAPYLGETRLTIGEPDISAHALGGLPRVSSRRVRFSVGCGDPTASPL